VQTSSCYEGALLDAVRMRPQDLRPTENDQYGQRYVLDFNMTGTAGSATVRSTFEVEFSDDEGRAYAQLALLGSQLLVLHYQPQRAA
jgi:hypothetical protein